MAIGRRHCRAHVVGVRPRRHDLIDAPVCTAHGKVFSGPHGAAAAISGGSDSTAHIANVPGHVVGCHGRGSRLGNRINNGVLDESRESIRNAQSVHRKDQVKGADLVRWRRLDFIRLYGLWTLEHAHSEDENNKPVK